MSRRKGHRHRIHGNPFSVRGDIEKPDWAARFGRHAPIAVDIGFGRGLFVLGLARAHPEWNVVGLEIRDHLVDRVLEDAAEEGLSNVQAVVANANVHLDELFDESSLAFVSINFPDPWFKKRHHKRRVVQEPLLDALAARLTDGGELHAMSDFEPIALEILELLNAHGSFENLEPHGGFAPSSTTGIPTEREIHHGEKHAQPIHRMHFRKKG
ncbi:MAG: tRNA (guanosine(46)-N7)-methyltransferase TrmB [Myxococcota bacterium]